jgi:hypothetical protein
VALASLNEVMARAAQADRDLGAQGATQAVRDEWTKVGSDLHAYLAFDAQHNVIITNGLEACDPAGTGAIRYG